VSVGWKLGSRYVVVYTTDAHAQLRVANGMAHKQSLQLTVRFRARNRWRWARIEASWPRSDLRCGRGILTIEAKSWLTDDTLRGALGLKAFVRLKVGLGGAASGSYRRRAA
jgi:hypothetical protein